jgi:arylsulfatase A-like enzyme
MAVMSKAFGGAAAEAAQDFGVILPVFVGLLLPLDFINEIDGYVVYLTATEIMHVFAWGWAFYLGLGILMAAAIATILGLAGFFLPRSLPAQRRTIRQCLAVAIAACAFVRLGKVWLGTFPGSEPTMAFLGQHKLMVVFLICAGAFWAGRKWDWAAAQLVQCLRLLAVAGALVALLSGCLWLVSGARQAEAPPVGQVSSPARRPDIILLTVDTLSTAKMSLYGHTRSTTPRLDAMAGEFHVFDRFYANSNFTTPSINSLIHGVRPWTHRANQIAARMSPRLSANGLVAHLKRAGYETVSIATNPAATAFNNDNNAWFDRQSVGLLRVSAFWGIAKLGSRFPSTTPVFTQYTVTVTSRIMDRLLVGAGIWSDTDHFDLDLPLSEARRAVEQRQPERPLFLWVHLLVPHDPYAAPKPFLGRFDASDKYRSRFNSSVINGFSARGDAPALALLPRYEESIAYVDQNLGEFLHWLKARDGYRDAIIAITADHGESFSHGYAGHGGPLLVEELVHVPLLVKPAGSMAGRRWNTLTEQVDLMPTLLDLAGVAITGEHEGKSLAPVFSGRHLEGPVFSMNFERSSRFGRLKHGTIAMVEGPYKYVRYLNTPPYPNRTQFADQLFDVIADPAEKSDLISSLPVVAERMRRQIDEQFTARAGPAP